jgi:hypothetical protein
LTAGEVFTRVDLVYCQEVVEHIDEKDLGNDLNSFASGKYVLMTHALPGQGGYHHVNCQPSDYWIDHLSERGFRLLAEDTHRISVLAQRDGATYLTNTGMIFENGARV